MLRTKKAFTLIELLVIISIIGVLATLILVGLRAVRSKAQDVQKKADIGGISRSLQGYAMDNGEKFPPSHNTGQDEGTLECLTSVSPTSSLLVSNGYLDKIPQDKFDPNKCYHYFHLTSSQDYNVTTVSVADPRQKFVASESGIDKTPSDCYGPGPSLQDIPSDHRPEFVIIDNRVWAIDAQFSGTIGWRLQPRPEGSGFPPYPNPYTPCALDDSLYNDFIFVKGIDISSPIGNTDSAQWQFPTMMVNGNYNVYAWFPSSQKNTSAARYQVRSGETYLTSTLDTIIVDQRVGGHWVQIGNGPFHFYPGVGNGVLVDNKIADYNSDPTKNPIVVSDAIKFVKVSP